MDLILIFLLKFITTDITDDYSCSIPSYLDASYTEVYIVGQKPNKKIISLIKINCDSPYELRLNGKKMKKETNYTCEKGDFKTYDENRHDIIQMRCVYVKDNDNNPDNNKKPVKEEQTNSVTVIPAVAVALILLSLCGAVYIKV